MRIAVMGAGGIGGNLGGLLARGGNEVVLIARGAHLEAICEHGLMVKSPQGDFVVEVEATDDPGEVDPVELVLFTVKTYHNATAIPAILPLVGGATSVLTLQNGVESFDELGHVIGAEWVLRGAAYFGAYIEAPGVITNQGLAPHIAFGEADGQETPRAQRILKVFTKAGIKTELSTDIVKTLWTKFLLLLPIAGMTSSARTLIGPLLQYPEAREMWLAAMREVEAVGRAKGVNLDPNIVERMVELTESLPWDYTVSMHTDLELGRPLELDALNGAVVRIGRQVGVPTPVNQFLYSILKPHKDGAISNT
jgi:2-dehydropantoate 2-reductase